MREGTAIEVNFDGLIGPTHNFGGLSRGNLASEENRLTVSNPRKAALQGLGKMKLLSDLGVGQAVIPPQQRPDFALLREAGIEGSEAAMLERAQREVPRLLDASYSASSMWVANAATVSPGADTADGLLHLTPANLITQLHRSIEPPHTAACLKVLFNDDEVFAHHPPLPPQSEGHSYGDEGAANHSRLCPHYGEPGIELFVYGCTSAEPSRGRLPARQTLEASRAVARRHCLDPERTVFARQSTAAIDAGVFHNDLVAVGNEHVFVYHESAFDEPAAVGKELRAKYDACGAEPTLIEVGADEMSIAEAVRTYLFNSQIVTRADGSMAWIAPRECESEAAASRCLRRLLDGDNPIQSAHYVDLSESMKNGGGPACLRLRVVLTPSQLARLHAGALFSDQLFTRLESCIQKHYRDHLHVSDLADPKLLEESRAALDELGAILELGSGFYSFQRCAQSGRPK